MGAPRRPFEIHIAHLTQAAPNVNVHIVASHFLFFSLLTLPPFLRPILRRTWTWHARQVSAALFCHYLFCSTRLASQTRKNCWAGSVLSFAKWWHDGLCAATPTDKLLLLINHTVGPTCVEKASAFIWHFNRAWKCHSSTLVGSHWSRVCVGVCVCVWMFSDVYNCTLETLTQSLCPPPTTLQKEDTHVSCPPELTLPDPSTLNLNELLRIIPRASTFQSFQSLIL